MNLRFASKKLIMLNKKVFLRYIILKLKIIHVHTHPNKIKKPC